MKRVVKNIWINDEKFKVHEAEMTGGEIKEMARVPADNKLFLELPGQHEDEMIADD